MATLQGFIDEVITVIEDNSTIADYVPDEVPLDLKDTPASPVWASSGVVTTGPAGQVKYLHNVRLGILGSLEQMPKINDIFLPELETIVEALQSKHDSGFTNADTYGDITYTYGPIEWAGIMFFGFLITIEDVKIRRTY